MVIDPVVSPAVAGSTTGDKLRVFGIVEIVAMAKEI